jgi:2-iminobutanoate/2-iminopropanoate deaminase
MNHAIFSLIAAIAIVGCSASRTYMTDAQVIGPYTPAVRVGDLLYVSGQIGLKPGTSEFVGDDIESQTRQALENLRAILTKAGYEVTDVVQCTVYLKNMGDYSRMNQVYGSFFQQGRYPTRTAVEVANLPRNAKIEITAVACKGR